MSHPFFDNKPTGASHPFFDDSESNEELASSAIGRMTLEAQDKERRRRALQELFNKPTTSHEQKQRIARLLAAGEEDQNQNSIVGNLARGAAGGLVKGMMTSADLAGTLLPDQLGGTALRRSVQEAGQNLNEMTGVDQNSTAGQIGEFAGGMAGAMLPMGGVARGTGMALGKLIPAAKPLLTGAVEGSMLTRAGASAAANVATGLPLNLLQAATLPEGTPEEKRQMLLEQVGADALFGAAFHPSKTNAGAAKMRLENEAKLPGVTTEVVPAKEDLIAQLQAKATADKAAKALEKARRDESWTLARAEWQLENKKSKWKDLSKEQKKAIVDKWVENNPAEVVPVAAEVPMTEAAPAGGMTSEQSADFIGELAVEQAKVPDPMVELKAEVVPEGKAIEPEASSPVLDTLVQTPEDRIRAASAAEPFLTHMEIAKQLGLPGEQVKAVMAGGKLTSTGPADLYDPMINFADLPVEDMRSVWDLMTVREREDALRATGKGARALRDLGKDKFWEALKAEPDRFRALADLLQPNIEARRTSLAQAALEAEQAKVNAPTALAEAHKPLVAGAEGKLAEIEQATEMDLAQLKQQHAGAARQAVEGKTAVDRLKASEQVFQLKRSIDRMEAEIKKTLVPAKAQVEKLKTTLEEVVPEGLAEPPQVPQSRRQTPPMNYTNDELSAYKKRFEWELAEATEMSDKAKQSTLIERIRRIDKETNRRQEVAASAGSEGLKAQMPVEMGSFLAGFTGSVMAGDPEDENLMRNAFLTGMGTALAGHGMKRLYNYHAGKQTAPKSALQVPGLDLAKNSPVVTKEMQPEKVTSIGTKLRRAYYQLVRSSGGAEYMVGQTGGVDMPTERNPGKRIFLFGRYIGQTENALTNRLAYEGPDGNPVVIQGVQTPHQILKMVAGDKEGLGNVAVALASAEGAGLRDVPMDQVMREAIIRAAPPEYITAAQELRKYNLGLMEILLRSGRISEDGFAKMASENWYTPMQRILDDMGAAEMRRSKNAKQPEALHGRKGGGDKPVLNPIDATIDMTARVLRAAEYGKTVNSLIDYAESQVGPVGNAIAHPVHRSMNKALGDIEKAAAELQKAMKISRSDAESMLAYMHLSKESMENGIVTAWRDGKLSSWKVNGEVFDSVKAMMPYETDMLTKWLAAPARVASKGVVMNPAFVGMQFFVDSISAGLFSKYGFRPGWDSFRGWWHDVSGSEQYKKMLDLGGPSTIQSLDYTNPKWSSQAVSAAGVTKLGTAWNQVKDLHPWQAYKTLIMPVAEAARVGEYLRALDHGASTLEAVYASWDILGNPRMQGAAPMMRAVNMMTMFTRPSIAAMDKLWKETGTSPWVPERDKTMLGKTTAGLGPRAAASVNLGTKVLTGITLPSLLLWLAQKDDEEVRQLRQTSTGAKYWIIRGVDSKIYRLRKPYVLGEIFGTGVENILDEQYTKDPAAVSAMAKGLIEDMAVNYMPLFGTIPVSLFVNKDLASGMPITPSRDSNLPPGIAGYTGASKFGQAVGELAAPMLGYAPETVKQAFSPKGVDYIVGSVGGMLGRDFLRAVNGAAEWKLNHEVSPQEELPIVASFMSRYPSTNVKELGEFYRWAEQVGNSVTGLDFYIENKPQKAIEFYQSHGRELAMAQIASDTRKKIGDMRRAIDDLRKAPPSVVSMENRRAIEKQMMESMIELARGANTAAAQMGLR